MNATVRRNRGVDIDAACGQSRPGWSWAARRPAPLAHEHGHRRRPGWRRPAPPPPGPGPPATAPTARPCPPRSPLAHHRLATGCGQVGGQIAGRGAAVEARAVPAHHLDPAGRVRFRHDASHSPDGTGASRSTSGHGMNAAATPLVWCRRSSPATSSRIRSRSQPAAAGPRSPGAQVSPLSTSTPRPAIHGRSRPSAPAVPSASPSSIDRWARPSRWSASGSRPWKGSRPRPRAPGRRRWRPGRAPGPRAGSRPPGTAAWGAAG